tara:strand:- start:1556 stop:1909 length:354 start_codon:yes stop_codon:yes gene_type:complete
MSNRVENFHKRVLTLKRLRPNSQYTLFEDGSIQWDKVNTEPVPTEEEIEAEKLKLEAEMPMKALRHERDKKLKESDWVSGEDVPQSIKDAWFPYRQALRDITNTYTSLDDVVWPSKP